MRVGIILTHGQHLHDRIISPSGETWVHKTSLTPPLFIEVHITSPESRKSCICVLRVSCLPLSTISLVLFGNVPTMWCFFGFQFIFYKTFSSCALSRITWQSYNSGNKLMLRTQSKIYFPVNGPELTKYNIYLSYYRSLDTTTDRLLVLDGIILLKVSLYGLICVLLKFTVPK